MPDVEAGPTHARILLAEDDPVSATFLSEALQNLGCRVHSCTDGDRALALARAEAFDLLLLDCRLPGRGARDIVNALREDSKAASRHAPVLACSADVRPELERQLRAAGCRAVLRKPLQMHALENALRDHLDGPMQVVMDDRAGLRASGNGGNLRMLRTLFLQELDTLSGELATLLGQPQDLHARLHRLLASCGFCGASALAEACRQLLAHVDVDSPCRNSALASFRATLESTRQNVHEALSARRS